MTSAVSSVSERRRRLLERCAGAELTAGDLVKSLHTSPRTIASDLAWAKERFPGRFLERIDSRHRKHFRFDGAPPVVLDEPIAALDHDELVAIVAARGLLRVPSDGPAERGSSAYSGLLDGALDRLLRRSGAIRAAVELAPEAIQVYRFAARSEDPAILAEVVASTVGGASLRFEYTNRQGVTHPVHAAPRRLVLFRGEFHAFMWTPTSSAEAVPVDTDPLIGRPTGESGRIKQYRVGRMRRVERTAEQPRGCPLSSEQWRIDRELAEAFEATGSMRDGDRHRVRLAISPKALPHVEDRTWGGDQRWIDVGAADGRMHDPAGWRRLEFTTTGLEACRHWVLSFGAEVRAESPASLVRWLREEALRLVQALSPSAATSLGQRASTRHGRDEPSAAAARDAVPRRSETVAPAPSQPTRVRARR